MEGNYIKTGDAEIYTHEIQILVDEFIANELGGREENVRDNFMWLVLYISDRLKKPDNSEIEILDSIFDAFVNLCLKYQILPTLEAFSLLVKINRSTFTDWKNQEYRKATEHGNTVKKWLDICKSCLVERLHRGGVDANLIFVAKAAYGMRETTPIEPEKHDKGVPEMSAKEVVQRLEEHRRQMEGKVEMPRLEDFGLDEDD